MLDRNLPADAYGFEASKKRPSCVFYSQPDSLLHDKIEEHVFVQNATTQTFMRFLGPREEFAGWAEALKESQRTLQEHIRWL